MLTEKTKKLVEETNELKEILMKQLSFDVLESMDEKEFMFMKKTFKLLDDAMKLVVEQAVVMDEINDKLDKLLAIAESND